MQDNLFLVCDSVHSILQKLKRSSTVSDLFSFVLFCLPVHHTPSSYPLMTLILYFGLLLFFLPFFFTQACLQHKLTNVTFFVAEIQEKD